MDSRIDIQKESKGYSLDTELDNKKTLSFDRGIETKQDNFIQNKLVSHEGYYSAYSNTNNVIKIEMEQEIISLSGKQKIIFETIIEICITRECLSTGPVQTLSLAKVAQTTTGTIKTIIRRLIDKKLIIRHPGRNAKGGYINLGVTEEVLQIVKNIKNTNKHNLFESDIIILNRYQKDINHEHISNSNFINTTTNISNKRIEKLPSEWDDIEYEILTHIGFSKTQIKQLVGKNDPTIVQESINHFAFGLENNPKVKKYEEPLNVLMGVLRKGQSWIEADYRSPLEIAQQKLLEAKKAEIERKRVLEEEAFKLALSEWTSSITEEERSKITAKTKGDLTPPAAKISTYFRDNIWSEIKNEYLVF